MRYTIVIRENNISYQITKVVFMNCGGFSLFTPYHNANEGLLSKYRVDYATRNSFIECVNSDTYNVHNKAKLSLHGDGSIQFSSINKGEIVSGKNEDGTFKGLGIKIPSLSNIIMTGPICAVTLWGIKDFQTSNKKKNCIIFNEEDMNYRNCSKDDWNAYTIEFTQFPKEIYKKIEYVKDQPTLILRHYNYEIPGTVFFHKIIPYKDNDYILGVIVTRVKVDFTIESGFILSSPSEMLDKRYGNCLIATYPIHGNVIELVDQSLDYKP